MSDKSPKAEALAPQDAILDLPDCMFRSGDKPEDTEIAMARRLAGLSVDSAKFTDIDGWAMFEGDIVLDTAEEARRATVGRGVGISGPQYRWPDGIVFYVAVPALEPLVAAAIAHWEQHTPIRFRPHTSEPDFVSFEQRDGCWSRVGRQGGRQVISLGAGCRLGSAIHEIGHTLGLWHEQSRSDRDDYVTVLLDNVVEAYRHNFDKHVLDGDDLGGYDYGSIMHYPATAFSKNGQPTIVTKDGRPIGQRNGLSRGDVRAIKLMYPLLNWANYPE